MRPREDVLQGEVLDRLKRTIASKLIRLHRANRGKRVGKRSMLSAIAARKREQPIA